jgi:hypothetical protein
MRTREIARTNLRDLDTRGTFSANSAEAPIADVVTKEIFSLYSSLFQFALRDR